MLASMSPTALVSAEEYLNTAYEPDADFVDGMVRARNVGTLKHGLLQSILIMFFGKFVESHRVEVFTETRLRVTPIDAEQSRYRVPDVMVLKDSYQMGRVSTDIPVIVVEVKSPEDTPEDTLDDILERCFDYEVLGVPNIVVMDPDHQLAWMFENGTFRRLIDSPASLKLGAGSLEFPFAEMFARLYRNRS